MEQLGKAGLVTNARVAVEKPFGSDLRSARELNARLHQVLRAEQILRVDHFLGKELVIELEYLRFANLALAEVWDRKSVSAVQITMAEDFGVEDRGAVPGPRPSPLAGAVAGQRALSPTVPRWTPERVDR